MFVANRGEEEIERRGRAPLHCEQLAGNRRRLQAGNRAARMQRLAQSQQIHQLHFDLHIDGRFARRKGELKALANRRRGRIADLNEEKRANQMDDENVAFALESELGVQSTDELEPERERRYFQR